MSRLTQRYGASPRHLAALVVGGAVSVYAITRVPHLETLLSIGLWFVFMLLLHDVLLFPAYASADNAAARLRARSAPPRVPWTNYLRVPTVLSGLLLLAWFPLILRLSAGYPRAAGRSAEPYLWHWLAVTAVLFAVSLLLYLARLFANRA